MQAVASTECRSIAKVLNAKRKQLPTKECSAALAVIENMLDRENTMQGLGVVLPFVGVLTTGTLVNILVFIFSLATTVVPIFIGLIPKSIEYDPVDEMCALNVIEAERARAALQGLNATCAHNMTLREAAAALATMVQQPPGFGM